MYSLITSKHSRRSLFALISLLFAFFRSVSTAATSDPSRLVVMVSVDGLAGDYLDDPKAEMPTIRALAAEGARAANMRCVIPTVTWPNHTTLVTGVMPAGHGVV